MRVRHGVHMYNYEPWNLEKVLKREMYRDWKPESRMKRNRPLCGARCRDGHSCKAKAVANPKTDKPINGRCRMHGGLSVGPKTKEGKARCREAARRGMLKYWEEKKANGIYLEQINKRVFPADFDNRENL